MPRKHAIIIRTDFRWDKRHCLLTSDDLNRPVPVGWKPPNGRLKIHHFKSNDIFNEFVPPWIHSIKHMKKHPWRTGTIRGFKSKGIFRCQEDADYSRIASGRLNSEELKRIETRIDSITLADLGIDMADGGAWFQGSDEIKAELLDYTILVSAGLNGVKVEQAEEIIQLRKKLKWYDYLFKTSIFKDFCALESHFCNNGWYIKEADERRTKKEEWNEAKDMAKKAKKEPEEEWFMYDSKRYEDFINISLWDNNHEYLAKLEVNKQDLKKSIWRFYQFINGKETLIIESSVERILGERSEQKNIEKVCTRVFPEFVFPLFRSEGFHRVYYFLMGKEYAEESEIKIEEKIEHEETAHRLVGIE